MNETEAPKKKVLADREGELEFAFKIGDCVRIKHFPHVKFVVYERWNYLEHPHYSIQNFDDKTDVRYYQEVNQDILELCPKQEDPQN